MRYNHLNTDEVTVGLYVVIWQSERQCVQLLIESSMCLMKALDVQGLQMVEFFPWIMMNKIPGMVSPLGDARGCS